MEWEGWFRDRARFCPEEEDGRWTRWGCPVPDHTEYCMVQCWQQGRRPTPVTNTRITNTNPSPTPTHHQQAESQEEGCVGKAVRYGCGHGWSSTWTRVGGLSGLRLGGGCRGRTNRHRQDGGQGATTPTESGGRNMRSKAIQGHQTPCEVQPWTAVTKYADPPWAPEISACG